MRKQLKGVALLFAALMLVGLAGCSAGTGAPQGIDNNPNGVTEGRSLAINMPTGAVPFYTLFAEDIRGHAEADGMTVQIDFSEFDPAKQIEQIENYITQKIDDLLICPLDNVAMQDPLIKARQAGINVCSFAFYLEENMDAYDTVVGVDQFAVGQANAENASDWIDKTFADAPDAGVKVALILDKSNDENIARSDGISEIANLNGKVEVVAAYEMATMDAAEVQNTIDQLMIEHPDVNAVIAVFASTALAADEKMMQYAAQIDIAKFAIFSCDWDEELKVRILKSVTDESTIRGTGTYSPAAYQLSYEVLMGMHNSELNELKQYMFPVVKITPETANDY
jgi:ribose transport system substrate-binding protein